MTQTGVASSKGISLLDFLMANFSGKITIEEFTRIRNFGSEEEIAEAVARMEAAGGYDALED